MLVPTAIAVFTILCGSLAIVGLLRGDRHHFWGGFLVAPILLILEGIILLLVIAYTLP
jgi:hypothetical protein